MPSRLLVTALMIAQLTGAHFSSTRFQGSWISSAKIEDGFHLYLPSVAHQLPLKLSVRVVEDRFTSTYTSYIVQGYLINASTEPLYSASVLVQQSVTLYMDTIPSYTRTMIVSTLFSATLPGQLNPFYAYVDGGSRMNKTEITAVEINRASYKTANDSTYISLDDPDWVMGDRESGYWITGTVRNTSSLPVRDVGALVLFAAPICGVRESALITTTLQPGASTQFGNYGCNAGDGPGVITHILAQGRVALP